MRYISELTYKQLLSEVLGEEFELVAQQRVYLEVTTNELQYMGRIVSFTDESGFCNAADVTKLGAVELAVANGSASVAYVLYDNLFDAQQHALRILQGE